MSFKKKRFVPARGDVALLVLACVLGGTGQLFYFAFVLCGPFGLIGLGNHLDEKNRLVLDGILSFCFFLQHSIMVRRSFKEQLSRRWGVPRPYHCAMYTTASGAALILQTVLWQASSSQPFVSVQGVPRLLLRAVFVASVALTVWMMRSLNSSDFLGIKPFVDQRIRGGEEEVSKVFAGNNKLVIRGAFQYVRHPGYLACIGMIWSFPDVTADRLLFNAIWTCWIIVGTCFEERDLIEDFGHDYKRYQTRVPMLVPNPCAAFTRVKNE